MKNKMLYLIFCLLLATTSAFATIESHQPYYVGELGPSWQFPSDHLPRGATMENFHIVFWNILNKNYLGHIEENTQGLRHSSILTDNVRVEPNSSLTVREMKTAQMILEMINHPTHPRSLIALQETHKDVQKYLRQQIPETWKIATPPNQPNSQDIFLYDGELFELISIDAVKYSPEFPKTIFTLTLKEKNTNKVFRFLQSHIPGGPVNSAAGCAQFSQEALRQYDPALTIVLMGDMNQSPDVIQKALEKAAVEKGMPQPFTYLPIAHPSHMNTNMEASWIDNFFTYSPETTIVGSDNPEEVFDALVPIVELLNGLAIKR